MPQAQKNSGVPNASIDMTDDALSMLIKFYCRESGVRNLQKQIEKVGPRCRNLSFILQFNARVEIINNSLLVINRCSGRRRLS
jgi:ATP-dependent Lon protease